MLWDSVFLPVISMKNVAFMERNWWQRLLGDGLAMVGCFVLYKLESKNELPKGPRFTIVFIYNICIAINLIVFGYFFGGN
jgi:hypothetical protein